MLLSDFFSHSPATPAPGEDVELDRIVGLVELSGTPVTPRLREIIDTITNLDYGVEHWRFNDLDVQGEGPCRAEVFAEHEETDSADARDLAEMVAEFFAGRFNDANYYELSDKTAAEGVTRHYLSHYPAMDGYGAWDGIDLYAYVRRATSLRRRGFAAVTLHSYIEARVLKVTPNGFTGTLEMACIIYDYLLDMMADAALVLTPAPGESVASAADLATQ